MTSMISPTGAAEKKRVEIVKMLRERAARMFPDERGCAASERRIQRVADVLCSPEETIWIPRSWLERSTPSREGKDAGST